MTRDIVAHSADELFLLYHRPSGETHVVAAEMMAILTALDATPGDANDVTARLVRDYDLEIEGDEPVADVIAARLAELASLGLIDIA